MEIISFEKQAFEEVAAKLDYFVQRIDSFCRLHGEKEKNGWMASAGNCASVREPCRPSATMERLPLPKSATGLTIAPMMWSVSFLPWKTDAKGRNGKAAAFDK